VIVNKFVHLVQICYDFDGKFVNYVRIKANDIWFFKLGIKM